MKTRILIIGGMGPQASIDLHHRIISRAAIEGANDCEDFPMIAHYSLPASDSGMTDPSKLHETFEVVAGQLPINCGHQFTHVIIACNTMHVFIDDFENLLGVRPMSLIERTVAHVNKLDIEKVGLLATPTTVQSGLYSQRMEKFGVEAVTLNIKYMADTEKEIQKVIGGELQTQVIERQISDLISQGCERVILGCTELSVLNTAAKFENCIDPLDCVVEEIFRQDNRV